MSGSTLNSRNEEAWKAYSMSTKDSEGLKGIALFQESSRENEADAREACHTCRRVKEEIMELKDTTRGMFKCSRW